MKITEIVSITELARLLKKSRPTVYKYISEFEDGNTENLPESIRNLFVNIRENRASKMSIYEYCKDKYSLEETLDPCLEEIIRILKENESILNLNNIKKYILKELQK